ncbi:hypothetical protein ACFXC8_29675 [Streptomyces sp. NPDC059441]|uniref:hypothetical protein n=1 Tax=Streptomyces sp. NPDC059441 TaxID=3346829 RepID=UPI0036919D0F
MQAEDRGFSAAFLAEFPDAPDVRRERARAESGLARLVQRAKDTGQLRNDFDTSDVTLLLLANNGVLQDSPAASIRVPPPARLLPPVLSTDGRHTAARTRATPPRGPIQGTSSNGMTRLSKTSSVIRWLVGRRCAARVRRTSRCGRVGRSSGRRLGRVFPKARVREHVSDVGVAHWPAADVRPRGTPDPAGAGGSQEIVALLGALVADPAVVDYMSASTRSPKPPPTIRGWYPWQLT